MNFTDSRIRIRLSSSVLNTREVSSPLQRASPLICLKRASWTRKCKKFRTTAKFKEIRCLMSRRFTAKFGRSRQAKDARFRAYPPNTTSEEKLPGLLFAEVYNNPVQTDSAGRFSVSSTGMYGDAILDVNLRTEEVYYYIGVIKGTMNASAYSS